ncbi:hypothetical protein [Candidatus Protochlamydia amoebophila]|uniref:Uncharacterized protein n=1 Tax=Protochlamydia amoebophila (strain UWE25) TaxID=264201 RepID=Q6MDH6_PARUW|nr:hypothetical protein [Candidatus Protochlamydia amoebophila]CAF23373.1 unnamed protein product [Candidatus Protochlamydia amoebophila UWE25]
MSLWKEIEKILQEMVEGQRKTLLNCGQRIIPFLTTDDILQPNDFAELENNPCFRYEEGILAGILSVQTALRANQSEISEKINGKI